MIKKLFILLLFALLYCNGNSDSDTTVKSELEYVYPENGSDTIPINHKFIISFDSEISPFDVKDYVTITKSNGSLVSFDIDIPDFSYLKKYKTFLLKPYFKLEQNTNYKISISNKLLPNVQTFLFTTADGDIADQDIFNGQDTASIKRKSAEQFNNLIKLYFKEHLNPYYVNIENIQLKIAETTNYIDCTVDYDFNKRCVLIYPDVLLQKGLKYIALYNDSKIEDLAGLSTAGNLFREYEFTLE